MNIKRYGITLALFAPTWPVDAHPFHWASESIDFVGGLFHPLTSLEHMLLMLAVGLWLSRFAKTVTLSLYAGVIGLMMSGVALSLCEVAIPAVEIGLPLSGLVLLASMILERKSSVWGLVAAAMLALLHGYQHAYDIWLDAGALDYTAGFVFSSTLLMLLGTMTGVLCHRLFRKYSFGKWADRLSLGRVAK